jgi:hypothetical protein
MFKIDTPMPYPSEPDRTEFPPLASQNVKIPDADRQPKDD